MPGIRPNKKELARMKALQDIGLTPTAIARRMGKSHHTVIKYLNSNIFDDPAIKGIVEKIKDNEIKDLYLLGAKARNRLHELLDEGNSKIIETTAVMDRTFQQRRLLEGKSTEIIDHASATKELAEIEAKLREYEEREESTIDITPDEEKEDENK
jgi:hypothetical protein